MEVETESRADESVAGVFGVEHQTAVAEEHEVGVSADRNISFDVERQGNVDAVLVDICADAATYEKVGVEADAVDVRDAKSGGGSGDGTAQGDLALIVEQAGSRMFGFGRDGTCGQKQQGKQYAEFFHGSNFKVIV